MTLHASDDPAVEVTAIIVTYNSGRTLPYLLDSLIASTTAVHAIVVDNSSQDDTLPVATSYAHVRFVQTGANLGYSGAINVGREAAKPGQHIAILNPDLEVAHDCLDHMLQALARNRMIGIVAPQLFNLDGTRFDSLRREPSVLSAVGDSLFGSHWPTRPRPTTETLRRESEYLKPVDVAWAGGAALLISSDCNTKVGPWDASTYFLYSEETDYARRARDAGFTVRYEPSARAWHIGSASGQPAELVALMSVNRVRYFSCHNGSLRADAFRMAVALQHALRFNDRRHRVALKFLIRPKLWRQLPGGRVAERRSPAQ